VAIDYKKAGVDIEAGDALVDWLRANKTKKDKRVLAGIGGFAALFRADFKGMKKPCLVSSTDGVGTKVLLAAQLNRLEGIGQDLVAMCVNDLICVGADPLFFLDYYACGKLNLPRAKAFLESLQRACAEVNCALIGGETAEMPGVYKDDDFDCAGFAVGVVDEDKALNAKRVKAGDVIIAVPSSGFHSNGYSLLRKVFSDDMEKWADILMTPTALYAKLVKDLRKKVKGLRVCANITGGGLENIPRVLPKGMVAKLEPWRLPEPFLEVQRRGQMSWESLTTTLNCGVGFVVIVDAREEQKALKIIRANKFAKAWTFGKVMKTNTREKNPSGYDLDFKAFGELNSSP
jgi:phosphoribosylformylglycinamidine cyclo-ligase